MVEQISGSRSDAHWPQPRPSSTETQYCINNRVIYGFGDGDTRVCPSKMEYNTRCSHSERHMSQRLTMGQLLLPRVKTGKKVWAQNLQVPPDISPTRNQVKEQSKYIACQKCIWKERQAISGKGWTRGKKRCPSIHKKKPLEQVYP